MHVDLCLSAVADPDELASLAMLAEAVGIRTVWTASYPAARDPWSNLVAAARATSCVGLGAIAVNPFAEHPLRIATGLLTLNEYAGGRARIVVGGGGEALQALGIAPARRVRAVSECVQILCGLRSKDPLDFDGEIFRVRHFCPTWVRSTNPPVYVAANKPQMLRMAARHSDGVMLSDLPAALCAERIGWVQHHLAEFGRADVPFSFNNFLAWHVYDDPARGRREARKWLGYRGLFRRWVLTTFMSDAEYDVIEAHKAAIYAMVPRDESSVDGVPDGLLDACVDHLTLTGAPADLPQITDNLLAMAAAGCTDVVLELHDEPAEAIRIIGESVLPVLRRATASRGRTG